MSARPAGRLLSWAIRAAGLLVVLQLAYAFVPDRHAGWATALVVLAFLAASLLAAAARSGWRYAVAIAGTGLVVGAVAEAVGVATGVPFGDYAYTDRLGPRLLDVPLVVPLAWAMMAYPAWRVAETLAGGRAARVVVAALALAAWDVALDPQMVGFGFWDVARRRRLRGHPADELRRAGWRSGSCCSSSGRCSSRVASPHRTGAADGRPRPPALRLDVARRDRGPPCLLGPSAGRGGDVPLHGCARRPGAAALGSRVRAQPDVGRPGRVGCPLAAADRYSASTRSTAATPTDAGEPFGAWPSATSTRLRAGASWG